MAATDELTFSTFIELYIRKNMSLSKIGKIYGISRQRVHQIKQELEKKHGKITRRISIDPITLKHYLEQGWNASEIAKHFNMTPSKISRLIRQYQNQYEAGELNIAIKRKKAQDILTKKELSSLYTEQLYTDKEIGEKYQLSSSTVSSLRKEYGIRTIHIKKIRELLKLLSKEIFIDLYINQKYTLKRMAKAYNCSISSILKIKNIYQIDKKAK